MICFGRGNPQDKKQSTTLDSDLELNPRTLYFIQHCERHDIYDTLPVAHVTDKLTNYKQTNEQTDVNPPLCGGGLII